MTLLWPAGVPVAVTTDPHGNPVAFTWQGRRHHLVGVVQRWQVDVDWWTPQGRSWREYMAVLTADHLLCVLYLDLSTAEWRLVRLYD